MKKKKKGIDLKRPQSKEELAIIAKYNAEKQEAEEWYIWAREELEPYFQGEYGTMDTMLELFLDESQRRIDNLLAKQEAQIIERIEGMIGEDKPTNTGLPMLDEPNIYQNMLRSELHQKLKALKEKQK